MKIDVYSHAIVVTDVLNDRDTQAMYSFCKPLIEHELKKQGRRMIPTAARTFASATRDRREFHFHRNQLKSLKEHLTRRYGYSEERLNITHHPVHLSDAHKVAFDVIQMHTPRPMQRGIIDYVLDVTDPKYDPIIKMVTLQTGGGKMERATNHVRIPGGWKRIGKLNAGDYVIAHDGTPTKVLGVFPQGKKQLYRVTFYDGRFVDVGAEHLWQSYYVNTQEHCRWKVRDTLELKRLISMPNPRVYIPLMEPEDQPEQDLPIDPWLLGVLIGDGCFTQRQVTITTPDQFIVDKVNTKLTYGQKLVWAGRYNYRITGNRRYNAIQADLEYLGLFGCSAVDKFIPHMYLESSVEQRKELLKGLVDTDGYVNEHGTISYCTISEQLAKDVQYLVRSLGGMARIRTRNTVYTHNGEKKNGQLAYNVYIRLPKPSDAVSLPKKLARVNDANQYSHKLKLQVKSIEPVDVDDAVCIMVEHPDHLYVTKDFIVTHNTFIAMYCMLALGVRTVIHFKGGYVDRWKGDLIDTFKFARGELLVVRGAKDMIAIQQMALNNELHAKCIIITSGTMREYIRDYEQSNGCSRVYPITPMDFYPKLGVGFRITDELHQEFHNNYKIDLYTHVPRSLGLSATMVSSNPFKNKMYEIAYPTHQRHDGGGYNVYIGATAVMYHIDPDVKMTYQGAQGYSHVLFEGSLMRHRGILKSYFKIIETTFYNRFYQDREPGQKALIFFARVDMCTAFKEYLEAKYADLEIVRYVGSENDPYEDLLAADVGVTTVGSGGTAIDIPNLRCSLMTTAMDSRQANEQVLGRTRPLKDWPDATPEFIYFNCVDIDQHMKYHNNKKHTFNNKVVYHAEINSRHMVSLPPWNKK